VIDGFTPRRIAANGITHAVHVGGDGPGTPLVLLHGFPQTHMAWAGLAPHWAQRRRVIVPDLREAPADDAGHRVYSKREMTHDIAGILDALGIGRADILGHDRGARVAYRLALDLPERVRRLGIIEVVPTAEMWRAWGPEMAVKAWHWTFLAQPVPLPETLINAAPHAFLSALLAGWSGPGDLTPFTPAALESYRAQIASPERVAAMCADYRAGATVDRALDEADLAAGRRIAAPVHFLWARGGFPAATGDPAAHWRRWADEVTDSGCDTGHFAMEERPDQVRAAFDAFFDR
jgi:haloacetate dehalogenase